MSNQHNVLFLNNLRRLQWEHEIQYVGSLQCLPPLPDFFGSDSVVSDEIAIAVAFGILADMQTREIQHEGKVRIIGPSIHVNDLVMAAYEDERSTPDSNLRVFLKSLNLMEYERFISELLPGCWLPVEPPPVDESLDAAALIKAIRIRADYLREKRGARNMRCQIKEVETFIEQYTSRT